MAHETRINYKNGEFWIPELFVERLSEYICETFEGMGLDTFSKNLQNVYQICDYNRKGLNIGMVDFMFDKFITSESDKNALINVLEQTKLLLLSKGIEISVERLNELESNKTSDYLRTEWYIPIKTQSLIATIDVVEKLLNQTWQPSNNAVYYVGFPNPSGMNEI